MFLFSRNPSFFVPNKEEPLYSVATVAQAISRSEGSISGYFSNKGISTKGGITLAQVAEVMESPVRGKIIDPDKIQEIHRRLHDEYGYTVESV